jgi:NAD(P)-dependent dehydrogenase (short-subunit alcohol dehydrogenase family)
LRGAGLYGLGDDGRIERPAARPAILSRIPAGAMGSGEDVAAAVVYLASREAGYVTGPDAAREWRHGDDLTGGATALVPYCISATPTPCRRFDPPYIAAET